MSFKENYKKPLVGAIKFIHTLIFFGISFCIFYVLYSGITGKINFLTYVAILIPVVEAFIFLAFKHKCPLTILTELISDEKGSVVDICLPKTLADNIPRIFTPILVLGIVLVILNLMS